MTPKRKPDPPRDDREQSKRFTDAARELGPDETGEAFERAFKKVVRRTTGIPDKSSSSP